MYTEPTAETFKARYPEFESVSEDLIGLVLAEAIAQVGDTWFERDRARAQMLLAAHMLTMEGEPGRSITGAGVGINGPVRRRRVGDVEVEFGGFSGSQSGSSSSSTYGASIYGQQYLELLRKNFPAITVV